MAICAIGYRLAYPANGDALMLLDTLRSRVQAFFKPSVSRDEQPVDNAEQPVSRKQWLLIRNSPGANGMDFDTYPELPYIDGDKLDWNSTVGFTELNGTGKWLEQWIPLHESAPQVHVIYKLPDKRLYRLGYAMPVKEGRRYAVHVQHGAYWVEPR